MSFLSPPLLRQSLARSNGSQTVFCSPSPLIHLGLEGEEKVMDAPWQWNGRSHPGPGNGKATRIPEPELSAGSANGLKCSQQMAGWHWSELANAIIRSWRRERSGRVIGRKLNPGPRIVKRAREHDERAPLSTIRAISRVLWPGRDYGIWGESRLSWFRALSRVRWRAGGIHNTARKKVWTSRGADQGRDLAPAGGRVPYRPHLAISKAAPRTSLEKNKNGSDWGCTMDSNGLLSNSQRSCVSFIGGSQVWWKGAKISLLPYNNNDRRDASE